MNGTGVTLTSSNTGFEIASDDVTFSGGSSSPSASASASASARGGSTTAAPSASPSAKSGAGFIQISAGLFAGALCAAVALI